MPAPSKISRETIKIQGGLGPIQATSSPLTLEISPLTIFIGSQGTGKSLISQLLYFFHDAEYLLSNYFKQEGIDATVRKVVEGIRSGELTNRALGSFLTTDSVYVTYKTNYQEVANESEIVFYRSNRKINPRGLFRKQIDQEQALFGWQKSKRPLFIHIEEPETHLHPAAQVAIVKTLAYLANHGFRLVITTHSLVVLYLLNNLTLAYQKLPNKTIDNMPSPQERLEPQSLSAYLFAEGTVQSILDETGQIDEGLLGRVIGNLEVEFNRLQSYGILWE
jgi:predicted ATPase